MTPWLLALAACMTVATPCEQLVHPRYSRTRGVAWNLSRVTQLSNDNAVLFRDRDTLGICDVTVIHGRKIVALGEGLTAPLAVLDDGAVGHIENGEFEAVQRIAWTALWAGSGQGREFIVGADHTPHDGMDFYVQVLDVASGRVESVRIPGAMPPSDAVGMVAGGQLFIGVDAGEWGGGWTAINLKSREQRIFPEMRVRGFAEKGAETFAFGTSNELYGSVIASVNGHEVFRNPFREPRYSLEGTIKIVEGPQDPIIAMVAAPDGWWVFTDSCHMWRSDDQFSSWAYIRKVLVKPIYPLANNDLGACPTIYSAKADKDGVILATTHDGLVRVLSDGEVSHFDPPTNLP